MRVIDLEDMMLAKRDDRDLRAAANDAARRRARAQKPPRHRRDAPGGPARDAADMIAECFMSVMPPAIAFLFLLSSIALAEEAPWVIDADDSRLAIVYEINGKPWRGEFEVFKGEGRFDPSNLATAHLEITIDVASVDVGDFFGTSTAKSGDWLDVETHPTAKFTLRRLEPTGTDEYRAIGDLFLRGETHEVIGGLSMKLDDARAQATGGATFDRRLYGVGKGITTLFVTVGDDIKVEFDVVARPER
ncbi:MAG: YceI family protein [Pseudomonadota bacterium]